MQPDDSDNCNVLNANDLLLIKTNKQTKKVNNKFRLVVKFSILESGHQPTETRNHRQVMMASLNKNQMKFECLKLRIVCPGGLYNLHNCDILCPQVFGQKKISIFKTAYFTKGFFLHFNIYPQISLSKVDVHFAKHAVERNTILLLCVL